MLDHLKPKGSDLSKDAQVIRVGPDVARPEGYKTALIEGDDPFERAAAIDRFFSAARGKPSNDVVLYSADSPAFAMPAAAWAARSGDSVLPVHRNRIPAPVVKALGEHSKPNVFVLGPEKVISKKVIAQLEKGKLARDVQRIEGPNPVENAIAFARYEKGDFGWGVVVPGYNFALASTSRPADAAAAAALATRGVFAPLVLSDDAGKLPREARGVLPQRPAGLRGRPEPGRVQPRLDPGRRQGDLGGPAGAARSADRAHPCPVERAVDCGLSSERVRETGPRRARAHSRGRAPADGRVHATFRAPAPQPDPTLISPLPADHPARIEGEREIRRLDEIALGSERRGPIQEREHGLPSYRGPD